MTLLRAIVRSRLFCSVRYFAPKRAGRTTVTGAPLKSVLTLRPRIGYVWGNGAAMSYVTGTSGSATFPNDGRLYITNEISTRACDDDNLVRSVLPDLVKGINKLCVRLRVHDERAAVAMELGN